MADKHIISGVNSFHIFLGLASIPVCMTIVGLSYMFWTNPIKCKCCKKYRSTISTRSTGVKVLQEIQVQELQEVHLSNGVQCSKKYKRYKYKKRTESKFSKMDKAIIVFLVP